MTFSQFLNEYNGKRNVGNTTQNKGECVGLVAVWVDVLGLSHIWGHAMDLFANADEKFFTKILNTIDALPEAGDIVVFSKKYNGTFGHTGIATKTGEQTTFECFQQNDPLGSNCHLKTYKYDNVIGWLRPTQLDNQQALIDQLRTDRDKNYNMFVAVCEALGVGANVDAAVNEAKKLVGNDDILVMRDKQIAEANTQIADLQAQFTAKSQELSATQIQIGTLTVEVEKAQKTVDGLTQQSKDDQMTLQALKDSLNKPQSKGLAKILEGIVELFLRT